jgi:hypothetical protein
MTDEIEVTQADREAADLAFNVWDNTNELALAFARHRQAAIKERDAQIVAKLRKTAHSLWERDYSDASFTVEDLADAIERGEV